MKNLPKIFGQIKKSKQGNHKSKFSSPGDNDFLILKVTNMVIH